MGYIADGFACGVRPGFFKAIRSFDRTLGELQGNMQFACREFLQNLDYEFTVSRSWNASDCSIVFISDHQCVLDGFAIPLACPHSLPIRRVVFHLSALAVGRQFSKHSLRIWPRGNYRNLIFETHGFINRVAYLLTHRWGPWVGPGRAMSRMIATLQQGESLVLLPSGTVGDYHWRRGIGTLIQTMPESQPCFLAPVYLKWNQISRRVEIESPKLIAFSQIKNLAGKDLDSQSLANWLAVKYRERDWSQFS